MKKLIYIGTFIIGLFWTYSASAQTQAFPNSQPAWGQFGQWGYTSDGTNWNTEDFEAFIYKGIPYRLMPPTGEVDYDYATDSWSFSDPNAKYPLFLFLHGLGERGEQNPYNHPVYGEIGNNNRQLLHGGSKFRNAVNSGEFPGYVLAPQTFFGYFNGNLGVYITEIIQHLIDNNQVDPDRIYVNGLSAGGRGTWELMDINPNMFAAGIPMSAAYSQYFNWIPKLKYTPVWLSQGGLDTNPTPSTANQLVQNWENAGGEIFYYYLPNSGHSTWNPTWDHPDFWDWVNSKRKNQPMVFYQRTEFCPNESVDALIGFTAGFTAYEWRKDGVILSSETGNELAISDYGSYEGRFSRNGEWTEWSDPIVISEKGVTPSPVITTQGTSTHVLPGLDGSTSVTLQVPDNYVSYQWVNIAQPNTVLSTTNTVTVSQGGHYSVQVAEEYGCQSAFSEQFEVITSNSPGVPDSPVNLTAAAQSVTSINLNWDDNPNPLNNEDAFEIYRGSSQGGPYSLIAIIPADVLNYLDEELESNETYYYLVRGINGNGSSTPTNEAVETTLLDTEPPSIPVNIHATSSSQQSVSLSWGASTDNEGVYAYEIFANGTLVSTVNGTTTNKTVFGLSPETVYNFKVRALDYELNASAFSNQITLATVSNGLYYSYYSGEFSSVPDFSALTPNEIGQISNFKIDPWDNTENFAVKYEGYITIPISGTYTFYTTSDDGSMLYIDGTNPANLVVNNDGLHGSRERSGSLYLSAGAHFIMVGFFERTGGDVLEVRWNGPQMGKQLIPDGVLSDDFEMPEPPTAPTNIAAVAVSYNQIDISWTDNSDNESGFEVYRSEDLNGPYEIVFTTDSDVTTYSDNGLTASTTYHYKVRSIGLTGESEFASNTFAESAHWTFDNNLLDISVNGETASENGTVLFSSSEVIQGSHSLDLSGGNGWVHYAASSNLPHNAFSERSYSLWVKTNDPSSDQLILEEGGGTNGMVIAIDNDELIVSVRNGGTSSQEVISTPYSSTEWNHISVIFDNNDLSLYINGVREAFDNNVGFSTMNSHSDNPGLGAVNGGFAYNGSVGNFTGYFDDLRVFDRALTESEIGSIMMSVQSNPTATTLALPTPPEAVSNLEVSGSSPNSIVVSWDDNSTNEEGFKIYRSTLSNGNYKLIHTSEEDSTSYEDTGLFPNTTYYYKIVAYNAGGEASTLVEASGGTLNNLPVIDEIVDITMNYAVPYDFDITANDLDTNPIVLTYSVTPTSGEAFTTFSDNGDGTANIAFTPAFEDQGTYDFTITATDSFDGESVETFTLEVNDNYDPEIAAFTNPVVDETNSLEFTISATDLDGDPITFSVTNLPGFATFLDNEDNTATFTFNPGFYDAGTYEIELLAEDDQTPAGSDTKTISLTVNDKDSYNYVYVNFNGPGDGSFNEGTPWNNTDARPNVNGLTYQLNDIEGNSSGIEMELVDSWGPQYDGFGSNTTAWSSSLYPSNVARSFYFLSDNNVNQIVFRNLDDNYKYAFTFYSGRQTSDTRTTSFTINGQTVSLNGGNNTTNTVTLENIDAVGGEITLDVQKTTGAYAYLNAMVIEYYLSEGTIPEAPLNLEAVAVSGSQIDLTWEDGSPKDKGFIIYRSENGVDFDVVDTLGHAVRNYSDDELIGNTEYFYYLTSYNDIGESAPTAVISIETLNAPPSIVEASQILDVVGGEDLDIYVVAEDAEGEDITFSVDNLPSFATFYDYGIGYCVISLQTEKEDIGSYQITVHATDEDGNSSSKDYSIEVLEYLSISHYLNFTNTALSSPSPWNNLMLSSPSAGSTIALNDEFDRATPIRVTLVNSWGGINNVGVNTTNDSGVYPDNVIRTAYYTQTTQTVEVSGLSQDSLYNFTFFGSRGSVSDARPTDYQINGTTVTLNAGNNASNTVEIKAIPPAPNGTITITMQPGSGSPYGYINAMVITSYLDDGLPSAPSDFQVFASSKTSVGLSWTDNSSNETGFEIYRSYEPNNNFVLIHTTGPNVTSFENTGLSANTAYYYKVRAINNEGVSLYTEVRGASTLYHSIFVNLTTDSSPGTPALWNNTSEEPIAGYDFTVSNLKDDSGSNTGINMVFTGEPNFDFNTLGAVTGNNSGIYPDEVLEECYYVDAKSVPVKLEGLNINFKYNLIFFGSRSSSATNRTTAYTAGGQTVYLDANANTTETVQINNLSPNTFGEITFEVSNVSGTSTFGYLNALVIQGYVPALSSARIAEGNSEVSIENTLEADDLINNVAIYPNPFDYELKIDFEVNKENPVSMQIMDLSGKSILFQELGTIPPGHMELFIDTRTLDMKSGVYLLKLVTGTEDKIFRLVKR